MYDGGKFGGKSQSAGLKLALPQAFLELFGSPSGNSSFAQVDQQRPQQKARDPKSIAGFSTSRPPSAAHHLTAHFPPPSSVAPD